MALRIALGAGPGRLIFQLLVDSMALSCSGAILQRDRDRRAAARRNGEAP